MGHWLGGGCGQGLLPPLCLCLSGEGPEFLLPKGREGYNPPHGLFPEGFDGNRDSWTVILTAWLLCLHRVAGLVHRELES